MTSARFVLFTIAAVVVGAAAAFALWQTRAAGPDRLVVSTGSDGGTYAAFSRAFAATFGPNDPVVLTVLPSAGADENAGRIARGIADLGLIQSDTRVQPGTRIVARLFPEAFHLVARTGSGIESVDDLRGARVGLLPEGAGSNRLFAQLLRHYEIDPQDLAIVHAPLMDLEEAIAAGEIDAFFVVIALGNESIARTIKNTPTHLVPIDQADAIALFDPALEAAVVPVGAYSGQRPVPDAPTPVVTVHSLLAASADLPDATVEAVTRALFESRQAMARTLPQAAFIAAPAEEDRLAFGVHPGAELYYGADEPLFVVKYAEPLALAVTALALLVSALWQARVWLAGARKNRADRYNLEIVDILSRIDEAAGDAEFEAIRRDLFEIFRKVLVDLDNDRIEEKSLLSFSFAWQVAASTLNHRQIVSAGASGQASPPSPVPAPVHSP